MSNRMQEQEVEEIRKLQHVRGSVYFLLSRLFLDEPEEGFISRLGDTEFFGDFQVPENDAVSEGAALLQEFFESQNGSAQSPSLEELKLEYTRLFLGPDSLPSPPWESAYRAESQILFGQETLEVRNEYAAFGLSFTRNDTEPDDHIGLELEFLYHLCTAIEEALDQGDLAKAMSVLETQKHFFEEHLNRWAPLFLADLFANAETLFYKGMAKFTSGFLQWDYRLALDLIDELRIEDPRKLLE